ncbi:MAG: hypothetical protein QQN44_01500, partial [Nitrosopumilus sp.]
MVKISVRSGRGTRIIEVDSDATKWTGAEYKAIQESKKKVAANTMVSSGRGTGRRRLGDIPEPKTRPEYKGTMTSGRGTGKKKK